MFTDLLHSFALTSKLSERHALQVALADETQRELRGEAKPRRTAGGRLMPQDARLQNWTPAKCTVPFGVRRLTWGFGEES